MHLFIKSSISYSNSYKWESVAISTDGITISSSQLNGKICYFNSSRITISGSVTCTDAYMNSNTYITLSGKLSITNLYITGTDNYNSGMIAGKSTQYISISYIYLKSSFSGCFTFASFDAYYSFSPSIRTSGYSLLRLNNKRLYRICSSGYLNYGTVCYLSYSTFGTFDYNYCPCEDDNCIYSVNRNEIDMISTSINYNLTSGGNRYLRNSGYYKNIINSGSLYLYYSSDHTINYVTTTGYLSLTPTSSVVLVTINTLMLNCNMQVGVNVYIKNMTVQGNYHIYVLSKVTSVSIDNMIIKNYQKQTLITNELSSSTLNMRVSNIEYSESALLIDRKKRDISFSGSSNIHLHCDRQAYIFNYYSIETCKLYNLYERNCYAFSGYTYYYDDKQGSIVDKTCPCNSNESSCNVYVYDKTSYTIQSPLNNLYTNSLTELYADNSPSFSLSYDTNLKQGNIVLTIHDSKVINIKLTKTQYTIITASSHPMFVSNYGFDSNNRYNITVNGDNLGCRFAEFNTITNQYDCKYCIGSIDNGTCVQSIPDHCESASSSNEQFCDLCEEGYYGTNSNTKCSKCIDNCRKCNNSNTCILCDDGYYGETCEEDTNYILEKIMKCEYNEYPNGDKCTQCDKNCLLCNVNQCIVCNSSSYNNGSCESEREQEIATSSVDGEICTFNHTYYDDSYKCSSCSDYGTCSKCTHSTCTICETGVLTDNGNCHEIENCNRIENSKCVQCDNGYYFNGTECVECKDCNVCENGICKQCKEGFILIENNECFNRGGHKTCPKK